MRGEAQPQGDDWKRATVGSAAAGGLYWRISCEDCRHELIISAENLIELHGVAPKTPFWTLAQKLSNGFQE